MNIDLEGKMRLCIDLSHEEAVGLRDAIGQQPSGDIDALLPEIRELVFGSYQALNNMLPERQE